MRFRKTADKGLELDTSSRRPKSKTPRTLFRSGRGFLRERVYTTFYFFVKGNIQLFLFFLELVSFQEHSCRIPRPIFLAQLPGLAGEHAIQKEDLCRII